MNSISGVCYKGIIVILMITVLANAAGIGGGLMIVVVMINALLLDNTKAIGLSKSLFLEAV